MTRQRLAHLVAVGLAPLALACGRSSQAAGRVDPPAPPESSAVRCGHTACGKDYFVDVAPVGACTAGETCSLALTLAARGDYHINDDYPYKFKADDAPGVEFLGAGQAGEGGKNVFSKSGSSWAKTSEKAGAMTILFKPSDGGNKTIEGVFKFSVCSPQNCELEQERLKSAVGVHDKAH